MFVNISIICLNYWTNKLKNKITIFMNLQVIKFAIKENYYKIIDKLLLKRIDKLFLILHSLHPKSSNVKKQKNP